MKKAQAFTNVWTYVVILFIFFIGVAALRLAGDELLQNENANVDNDTIEYVYGLKGINYSEYQATGSDLEENIVLQGNSSQGNPKDEAIDFLYAKQKASGLEVTIKGIYDTPKIVIVDVFRLPLSQWSWVINIVGWLLVISLAIAFMYYLRGISDK